METNSRTIPAFGVSQSAPLNERERIERLVQRLEDDSVALGRVGSDQFQRSETNKFTILLAVIVSSLTTLLTATVYFYTQDREPQREVVADVQGSLLANGPELQEAQNDTAANRLANALEASSKQLYQLRVDVDLNDKVLAKIASNSSVRVAKAKSARKKPVLPTAIMLRTSARNSSLDVKPTDSALPHSGADGIIDYWLIPRGPQSGPPTRVIPLGSSPDGVFVYNLADGKNYRITHSGEWFVQPKPPDNR